MDEPLTRFAAVMELAQMKLQILELFLREDLQYEQKYNKLFDGYLAKDFRRSCKALDIEFSYYDPDTGYEEDFLAFVQAAKEVEIPQDDQYDWAGHDAFYQVYTLVHLHGSRSDKAAFLHLARDLTK